MDGPHLSMRIETIYSYPTYVATAAKPALSGSDGGVEPNLVIVKCESARLVS